MDVTADPSMGYPQNRFFYADAGGKIEPITYGDCVRQIDPLGGPGRIGHTAPHAWPMDKCRSRGLRTHRRSDEAEGAQK